jgi:hypothetical protein
MNESSSDKSQSFALPSEETLRRLAISESGFVFDPVSGHNFTVNETGLEILRRLQQERDLPKLLSDLQKEYEVQERDLERDVIEFIGLVRDFIGD